MKPIVKTAAVAATLALFSMSANAEQRYGTPPPLSLSSDLSSPWTLQLKPKKRVASAREIQQAKRPRGLKLFSRKEYKPVKPKRKAVRNKLQRTGVARTASRQQAATTRQAKSDFNPELLPTLVNYNGSARPGDIVINTIERRLYLVLPGAKARRYAVGVGKPGFEWAGTHKVTRKAEWPSWTPPAQMIAREKKKGRILPKFMPGGIKNPMGARALYLGSTIYRIHGTNQAWSIGHAVSSGCIRMRNEDVMDLYDRVPVGARVKVI